AHQDRIEPDGQAIEFVRLGLSLPEDFRHNAKESASIGSIAAIRDYRQLEIAESQCLVLHSDFTGPALWSPSNSWRKRSRIRVYKWMRAAGPEIPWVLRGYRARSNCFPASINALIICIVFCMWTLSSLVPCT